jgi:short-subunit dehydrogenase
VQHLFTRELARRLHDTGVTANCLHPGFVATRFGDQSEGPIAHLLWLAKFFAISPAQGAETIVYLASSPDVATSTGQYYFKCRPTAPSAAARDDQSALSLWQRSAVLAGLKENGASSFSAERRSLRDCLRREGLEAHPPTFSPFAQPAGPMPRAASKV